MIAINTMYRRKRREVHWKDLVFVPANSKHSISNPGPGNLVAVFTKADRPSVQAPDY